MKISELSIRTRVPKETIHYYVREGLIPKPKKRGRNVADYDESFIERIHLIKEIQDHFFLPLSLIKEIIRRQNKSPELKALLKLRMGYFSPLDQLLAKRVVGEEAFEKATGMGKKWIAKFEEWGVITPESGDGVKTYSQDDVIIGRLLVDLDRAGFGPKDGINPAVVKSYIRIYKQIVRMAHKSFLDTDSDKLTPEEILAKGIRGRELMGVLFYHLYRKLAKENENEWAKRRKGKKNIRPQRDRRR
ncbi:MAG: MerR family transcriptional regulator [Thermodesulfobacteriota bacterium]